MLGAAKGAPLARVASGSRQPSGELPVLSTPSALGAIREGAESGRESPSGSAEGGQHQRLAWGRADGG